MDPVLNTFTFLSKVTNLERHGLDFIDVPFPFYEDMRSRLKKADLEL